MHSRSYWPPRRVSWRPVRPRMHAETSEIRWAEVLAGDLTEGVVEASKTENACRDRALHFDAPEGPIRFHRVLAHRDLRFRRQREGADALALRAHDMASREFRHQDSRCDRLISVGLPALDRAHRVFGAGR